jgi:hypothetical protein
MKKYFLSLKNYAGIFFTCCCFYSGSVVAQIIVSPGGAPSTIISSFVGAGLLVSNVQLNCGLDTAHAAYGTFSNGSLGLGLSQGVVLSTGSADNLVGPNLPGDSATTGSGSHYGYQDPQLVAIAGDTISDLCVLEFDVVPRCNSLQIKFVFGSEEYPEYVNAFNDAFGFFVTGPDGNCNAGFYDNTNVAQLPDGTPISVNNVNNGFSFACPQVLPGPCQNCAYYINNCLGTWVEYDGFTTVITVNLSVCPCATYHWKFAIADTRDALYDSGVMIETFACQNPLHVSGYTTNQNGCTCAGSATVNIASGTPPFTFLWSDGQTTQTATNLCAGIYSVQVMDANSCFPFLMQNIQIHELAVTANTSNVTCHALNNGTAIAFADGGAPPYTFVWDTYPVQTTQVATNLPAGLWRVDVTDSAGCTEFIYVSILEPDTFFIQLADTIYTGCQLNTGMVIPSYVGGTLPLTYLWNTNPPSTFPYAFGLSPGVYTVTATDANGCIATASSAVLSPDQVITKGDTTMCQGSNVLVEVFGASIYSWSPPDGLYTTTGNMQYVHPDVTTTYTIIGYCGSNILDTAYVTVTVLPAPTVTASPLQHVCHGSTVTLQASGAQRYSWQPDYYILSYSSDSSSVLAHPTSSANFVVTGYNSLGCPDVAIIPVEVQENNEIIINSSGPTIFCEGDETILSVTEQGSYLWSTGQTTQSITVAQSGTYSVTVTDIYGCTSTSLPVLIVVYPVPVPVITSSGPTELCFGDIVSLDLNVTPQADHYLWNTFGITQSIHVTNPGTYSVTVTDDRNCTATASISVNLHNPAPTINIFSGPALCEGSPALLNAIPQQGISFLWSSGSTNPSIVVTTDGTYSVTATDIYSCSSTASVSLHFNPRPEAVISPAGQLLICSGSPQTLQANAGPGFTYRWSRNGQFLPGETNQELIVTGAGSYMVRVFDSLGCFAISFPVIVSVGSGPEVAVSASSGIGCRDNVIYTGYGFQNVTLSAVSSSAVSYLWSTGETTQTISVNSAGTFSVTAYDAAGCSSPQNGQSQITITELDIRCGHNLQKVILCHVPEGNLANPQTICIAPSAIPAHLSLHQYDCLGPCPVNARLSADHRHDEIMVYPNPAGNELSVVGYLLSEKPEVKIYDMLGQCVFSQHPEAGSQELIINVSSFPSGIYFLKIYLSDEVLTKKFVKSDN